MISWFVGAFLVFCVSWYRSGALAAKGIGEGHSLHLIRRRQVGVRIGDPSILWASPDEGGGDKKTALTTEGLDSGV
jgi:hypothetical protein